MVGWWVVVILYSTALTWHRYGIGMASICITQSIMYLFMCGIDIAWHGIGMVWYGHGIDRRDHYAQCVITFHRRLWALYGHGNHDNKLMIMHVVHLPRLPPR